MCIVLVTYYLTSQWVWLVRLGRRLQSYKLSSVCSMTVDKLELYATTTNKQTKNYAKKKHWPLETVVITFAHIITDVARMLYEKVLMALCFGTNYSIVHSYGNYIIISRMQLTAI